MFGRKKKKHPKWAADISVPARVRNDREYKVELQEYITVTRLFTDEYGIETPRTLLKLSIAEAEKLHGDLARSIIAYRARKENSGS